MENQPTKSELLKSIQEDYQAWQESLRQFDDIWIAQVKIGEWTIKDIIAHITWHEIEMIGLLEAHALVGSPWWNLPTDQRNQKIYEQNRERTLEDVRQEAAHAHAQLVQLLEALPEADLYDPAGFPDMPSDWQPWMLIVQNTYEHYRTHLEDLNKRIDLQKT
ncbi:MAG: ClbS/DfsB family four-helix bundle protein [Anaerolineales bacterium]|nr:ClbS/DfsB family four-helix bundle protein [Anaerolineales bacterium]